MRIWATLKKAKNDVPTEEPRAEQPAAPINEQGHCWEEDAGGRDPMHGYTTIWASDLLDEQTCANCKAIDGREYASMAEATAHYPAGGYKHCESDTGCRGTLVLLDEDDEPEP